MNKTWLFKKLTVVGALLCLVLPVFVFDMDCHVACQDDSGTDTCECVCHVPVADIMTCLDVRPDHRVEYLTLYSPPSHFDTVYFSIDRPPIV